MQQQMQQQRSTLENVIQVQLGQAQTQVHDVAQHAFAELRTEVGKQISNADSRAQAAVVELSVKMAELEKGQKEQEIQNQR
eukprot:696601-Amphidinium_carterae.1